MDLLEKCLEAEEFDLVSEIVRYLTSVSSSANASRPQALNTGTLLAISADEEQTVSSRSLDLTFSFSLTYLSAVTSEN
jgi:hypothetical protein